MKGQGLTGTQPYFWHATEPAQKKNPFLVLTLPATPSWRFTLRKRTGFDRLGLRLGLTREILIHDPGFDTRLFLSTRHTTAASTLFARSSLRTAVLALFDRGFTSLELNHRGLQLKWAPYLPGQNPVSEEEMAACAARLQ